MREQTVLGRYENGPLEEMPLSQAPTEALQDIAAGRVPADPGVDLDFVRRYAAILLQERT